MWWLLLSRAACHNVTSHKHANSLYSQTPLRKRPRGRFHGAQASRPREESLLCTYKHIYEYMHINDYLYVMLYRAASRASSPRIRGTVGKRSSPTLWNWCHPSTPSSGTGYCGQEVIAASQCVAIHASTSCCLGLYLLCFAGPSLTAACTHTLKYARGSALP